MALTEVSKNKVFGGWQKIYSHVSEELGCKMNFGVYLPPQSESEKVPVIYWLSGRPLICTKKSFNNLFNLFYLFLHAIIPSFNMAASFLK